MALFQVDGLQFDLDDAAWPVSVLSALCGGTFELAERRLCKKLVRPGDVVVEFGTATGLVALVAARIAGAGAVTSFEADPDLVPVAQRAAALNDLVVHLHHAAVVDTPDDHVAFFRSSNFASSSTLELASTEQITAPAVQAEAVIAELRPTILIVDVEGGEAHLARSIADSGADAVIVEVHPHVIGLDGCHLVADAIAAGGFQVDDALCDGQVICFRRGHGWPLAATAAARTLDAIATGDAGERISALKAALERCPTNPTIRSRLARAFLGADRFEEALLEAEQIAGLAPDVFEGPVLAARACRRLGRTAEATSFAEHALLIAPDIGEVWQEASDAYNAAGQKGKAFACADDLVRRNPYGSGGWVRRARLALALRRGPDATFSIGRAVELKPGDPGLEALRGKIVDRFGLS